MSDVRPSPADSIQLLIVEDDDDSRDMLGQLAEIHGYRAAGAATVEDAIAQASRSVPKLALVDIGLSGSDGFQAARMLRQIPGGETIHLVALTGYSDEAARERARVSGFDDFIVKPLMPEKFSELLETWLRTDD